jgi:SAM-dependent methyltransferase
MALVLLVKAEDRESAASPEMRYLLSLVRLEAERTFGEAAVAGGAVEAEGADYVLLLSDADVLVRGASLAAMQAAVDDGADAAVPHRLADTGLAAAAAVYTLRDFERLEEAWLGGGEKAGGGEPPSLLPVSLLSGEAFRRLGPDLAAPGDLRVARAGLFHEFIDYYGEVRSDVVPFVPEGAGEILEVGCGRGATGKHLQEVLGCRVTGVELNPVVAEAARGVLHRVVVGDVEDEATVAELARRYDALLALELFEHLVEPELFLGRLRDLVRPGGRAVLSVPNVGHHSVVADLLAGRWDYLPIGILCYTHYRFYTRRTLADWLARCGFPDARLVPQRTEAPAWLAAASGRLPGTDLEIDEESLSTKGFYVLLDV